MTIFSSFPFAVGWKHSKILRPKENSEKTKAVICFSHFPGKYTVSEDIQTKTAPKKTAEKNTGVSSLRLNSLLIAWRIGMRFLVKCLFDEVM